jgi:hypothetical protein
VSSALTLSVPATMTVLGGTASLSSLEAAALGFGPGITLSGAAPTSTVALTIVAGDAAASLSVANADGATIKSSLNTLSLTGTQAQINLALAGLQLDEPAAAGSDVLSLSATDTAAVAVASGFAVDVVPLTGPALVAPPATITLHGNSLTTLSGLVLADPVAAGLAAMGLGRAETLSVTLSVTEGVLLLPGLTAASGVSASGLGTGTLELSCTADELGTLNTLLAGLEFAGPDYGQRLSYALWNFSGVLPVLVTYGGVALNVIGTPAANGTFHAGAQKLITGGDTFSGTLNVTGTEAVLGGLSGGTIEISPTGALEVPDDNMALTGSSMDFGLLGGQALTITGTLFIGDAASFANGVTLAPGARLDFNDGFTAFSTADSSLDAGLFLNAGAVLQGNGTLMAGNFSQGAVVDGGTLLALGGDTLEISASWLLGEMLLQVGGGGVMVLGPVSPLYGIFDTIPLTIDSTVTLNFQGAGAAPITGGYASTLGGSGGAFVITEPQFFSGTVTGFGLGDAMIFPDLASMSIYNVGSGSFHLAGLDVFGNTDTYTIFTSIASGFAPAVGEDAEGDEEVFMRSTLATVIQGADITATPGVPQPLLGVSLDMTGSNAQSLSVTLTAARGALSTAGGTFGNRIILTAANLNALNAQIAAVSYTGNGSADSVVFSSNTGLLAGVQGGVLINVGGTGTVSAYSGLGVSAANMVAYGPAIGLPLITGGMAVGGVMVSGVVEFENLLDAVGYTGTALLADGGGEAIFGAAAEDSLAGDVTLGDSAGAGTLMLLTDDFFVGGNVTLAQSSSAAGSKAVIFGTMHATGALNIGPSAAAAVLVEGWLSAGALSLGSAGTLQELGTGVSGFGGVINAGTLSLAGQATLTATAYSGTGAIELGGTSTLAVVGDALVSGVAAMASIGQGAVLDAGTLQAGGAALALAGLVSASVSIELGSLALQGGTIAAPFITATGTQSGYGMIAARNFAESGLLEAELGRLVLTGNVTTNSLLEIGTGAILEIGGRLGGAAVTFAGADAKLVLDDAAAGGFSAAQLSVSDAIDLVGIAPRLVSIPTTSTGVGYILNAAGSTAAQFGFGYADTLTHNLSITSDGAGGTLLLVDGVMPCFARGTGILGPQGYRPVETLRPNDPVITASGLRRPVRWIGWRTLDLGAGVASTARPVLIMPHAFGPGRPGKILRLSPSHCVLAGGVLIPVTHLVNGATILRDAAAQAVTYFHIELDRHDILLAEGLECESYFDDGNRAAMYRELGRRSASRKPFAAVVTSGARLAAVRRSLHARALAAGFSLRYQAALRGVAGGYSVIPEILPRGQGRVAHFAFPAPVRELTLLSATACPADTDPDSEDQRELGICLGRMPGVSLRHGWQARAAGDAGTWMGARAALGFARPRREINLPLAAIAQSWHRDMAPAAVDARRAGG